MEEIIFHLNGQLVPAAAALIHASDRGLLYGDGLFETMHAYGSEIFRLEPHLERLTAGAAKLAFSPLPDLGALRRACRETATAGFKAGYEETNIRLTVTRGTGPRGPSTRGPFHPTILVAGTPYRRPADAEWKKGATAVWASFRRQEAGVLATLKTLNYLEQILARREADAAGADEALLLNNAGLLCEGSASNLTLVRDGELVAPDPRTVGALPGLAQEAIFEVARAEGFRVRFAALCASDLTNAAEAFLSGSMRELTPLVRVGEKEIGGGRPGPVSRRLYAAYLRAVEQETGWQPQGG